MPLRGILGRSLRARCCRSVALAGACVLAAQTARLPLLAGDSAGCCCPHAQAEEKCGCPLCAHRRALQSGQRVLESCGAAMVVAAIPAPAPALPALSAAPAPRPSLAIAVPSFSSPPTEPALEVPPPPPLARG
jgi:hypothetical protein